MLSLVTSTARTEPWWPVRVSSAAPVARSHTIAVWSRLAVTARVLSRVTATARTVFRWPASTWISGLEAGCSPDRMTGPAVGLLDPEPRNQRRQSRALGASKAPEQLIGQAPEQLIGQI